MNNSKTLTLTILLIIIVTITMCSKNEDDDETTSELGACDLPAYSICAEDYPETACDSLNGTFAKSSECSTSSVVGNCLIFKSGLPFTFRYYSPGFDNAKAKNDCESSSGTFW